MIYLSAYAGMNICVAVSGGRDSMALLHYLYTHMREYAITLSAVNCNHRIRGLSSDSDSEFVKKICREWGVPLVCYEWDTDAAKTEANARLWRRECYKAALKAHSAQAVATAHHLDDNAETVLFNLARGSSLSGMTGITDGDFLIRPFISLTRSQIDGYVKSNNIPFVDDETNFTDDYTRNRIRHNVLPELEKAVPDAAKAIYRFSRLAAEDEEFFDSLIKNLNLISADDGCLRIKFCKEKVLFRRAAVKVIKNFERNDYTSEQLERLYDLQFLQNGKKFSFLNLTAYKEEDGITLSEEGCVKDESVAFASFTADSFCGVPFCITFAEPEGKYLKFDCAAIPETAEIRFMRTGDRFTKFGGGTKSLGDYFTDKKIPQRLRRKIPLIADGSDVLVIGGVEISEKVKITEKTRKIAYLSTDNRRKQ